MMAYWTCCQSFSGYSTFSHPIIQRITRQWSLFTSLEESAHKKKSAEESSSTVINIRLSANSPAMLPRQVFEKFAYNQVVDFLAKEKIMDLFQTGFRKHHSTQTASLKLTDYIRVGKENKVETLLLQFDFSKAFDKIAPSQLLMKLKRLSSSKFTLSWFWTYLSGRSQCVFSKSSRSKNRIINLGVPQGSVLGPLLFCLT